MLAHVETGTEFTCEFGDIDEGFYDSLYTTLDEMQKLLTNEDGRPLYDGVKGRLAELARNADGIGWGYGDYVSEVVEELETDLGEQDQAEA